MRVVLQRVREAQVTVDGNTVGRIGPGFVALVGITHTDTAAEAERLAHKTAVLRVFDDAEGRMNRSLLEVAGGVLVVSQFTLYADMRKGRRPSYTDAAAPQQAEPLVRAYAEALTRAGVADIAHGVFGAMMAVHLTNDGPATFVLDSEDL
jgi:D-aminoacyl-tRNA deacylase